MRPVQSIYEVSLPYGAPGDYAAGFHTGVDFACPIGTPVLAPQAGRVIVSGWDNDYGNYVTIMYTPTLPASAKLFLLAHLSQRLVKVGDTVRRGQTVGKSGKTGNARGAHLHAERRHAPFGYRDSELPPWK